MHPGARICVGRVVLPLLMLAVQPGEQPCQLLLRGQMQHHLDDHESAPCQFLFKEQQRLNPFSDLIFAVASGDSRYQYVLIVRAVEYPHMTGFGKLRDDAFQIVLPTLRCGWPTESRHVHTQRVHGTAH